jgi:three-Cys-motif partner protein
VSESLQQFGGSWTEQKLQRLREYLIAYHNALKNQPFTLYYIDAFAGTGYNTPKAAPDYQSPLFNDLAARDTRQFLDGSARLELHSRFHDLSTDTFLSNDTPTVSLNWPS